MSVRFAVHSLFSSKESGDRTSTTNWLSVTTDQSTADGTERDGTLEVRGVSEMHSVSLYEGLEQAVDWYRTQ